MDITLKTDCFLKTSLWVSASKTVDWMSSFSFCAHLPSQSPSLCPYSLPHKQHAQRWEQGCPFLQQPHLVCLLPVTFVQYFLSTPSSWDFFLDDSPQRHDNSSFFSSWFPQLRHLHLLLHLLLFRTAGFFFNCCLDAKAPTSGSCFPSAVTSSILRSFLWFRYI